MGEPVFSSTAEPGSGMIFPLSLTNSAENSGSSWWIAFPLPLSSLGVIGRSSSSSPDKDILDMEGIGLRLGDRNPVESEGVPVPELLMDIWPDDPFSRPFVTSDGRRGLAVSTFLISSVSESLRSSISSSLLGSFDASMAATKAGKVAFARLTTTMESEGKPGASDCWISMNLSNSALTSWAPTTTSCSIWQVRVCYGTTAEQPNVLTLLFSPFRTARAKAESSIIPQTPLPRECAPSLLARASARSVLRTHQLRISRHSLWCNWLGKVDMVINRLTEPYPRHLEEYSNQDSAWFHLPVADKG